MKNNGFLIAAVVVICVLVGFIIFLKQEAQKVSKSLETERYSRLVAEEKVVNTVSKIKQLENELKSSEEKIAKVQSVLKDQKTINTDLEQQFERLSKAKAELEGKLKEALAQQASSVALQQVEQAPAQPNVAVVQTSN